MAESEFDFLQDEFLSKRHKVEKWQDQKQKEGIDTKTATLGIQIRQQLKQMNQLVKQLKDQLKRLNKKKKDPPQILERKRKIVDNCQQLLKDLEEREQGEGKINHKKMQTLTDMKAKLLDQINIQNEHINGGSQGGLQQDKQQQLAVKAFKKKDEQMDVMVDQIALGLKGVRKQVQIINEAEDVVIEKSRRVEKKIEKVSVRIERDNDNLKQIIKRYKPSRCCLYIVFFLLLVGLVVTAIKLLA